MQNCQNLPFGYSMSYVTAQSLAGTTFDSEAAHQRHLAPLALGFFDTAGEN